jgi:hypothetical protein
VVTQLLVLVNPCLLQRLTMVGGKLEVKKSAHQVGYLTEKLS